MSGLLYEHLKKGAANAVTLEDLRQKVGANSTREVFDELSREQSAGFPVLSGCKFDTFFAPSDGPEGLREQIVYTKIMQEQTDVLNAILMAQGAVSEAQRLFIQYIGRWPGDH